MINMKTDTILNYRVHQALKRVTELIEFHIESLVKLGKRVPVETDNTTVITSVAIPVSVASHFSLA